MATNIVPNFKIPKGYKRVFFFEEKTTGFRLWIKINRKGIWSKSEGKPGPLASSRCLDWIQESIEAVRLEVQNVR